LGIGSFIRAAEKLVLRTKTGFDDVAVRVVKTIKPPFYLFVAFYLALQTLHLTPAFSSLARIALIAWAAFQVVLALQVAIDSVFMRRITREDHGNHKSILEVARVVARFLLWTVGGLFILSNIGVNISSLIAGLGVGGIAIALATQNILTDLFSSLVIYFDQPFAAGDFIEVGGDSGTVQKIGIKTTRIRSLRGEEIVIPNKDIAAARIKNFKRLLERRVEFTFAVSADLSAEKLAALPGTIQKVIETVPNVRFERAHIHHFDGGKPQVQVAYLVTKREFLAYMDAHQAVLLGLKHVLDKHKVEIL
jgi:small-conductance mechanosensitive channel